MNYSDRSKNIPVQIMVKAVYQVSFVYTTLDTSSDTYRCVGAWMSSDYANRILATTEQEFGTPAEAITAAAREFIALVESQPKVDHSV
jgi:hypothetical protein